MTDCSDDVPALVVDMGGGVTKAGFAGDDQPREVFQSLVGRPLRGADSDVVLVGPHAEQMRGTLSLQRPVEHGVVRDWDGGERLLRCALTGLGVEAEAQPVLLAEAALNPKRNREAMAECVFERLGVPASYIAPASVLSLYGSYRSHAFVVDVGDGVMSTAALFEGHMFSHAVWRVDVGGRDVTDRLLRLLAERGHAFTSTPEREVVRRMKEKLCYVARDFHQELSVGGSVEYELPDGQSIVLGSERFECSEALFRPSLLGMQAPGVSDMVFESIMACHVDVRMNLFSSIILSGGCTMLRGFGDRLTRDLQAMAPPNARVRVTEPDDRKYSVWLGGSLMASMSAFQSMWISRRDYEENGAFVVHRRCFSA